MYKAASKISSSQEVILGIPGQVQRINASLALQLCKAWLNATNNNSSGNTKRPFLNDADGDEAAAFDLDESFLKGLSECKWPGRFQTFKKDKITYFLDGAHTMESIETCVDWFHTNQSKSASNATKVLLFNCTGPRDAATLLRPLVKEEFDIAIFSPNKIQEKKRATSDLSNFSVDATKELELVDVLQTTWLNLSEEAFGKKGRTEKFDCLTTTTCWLDQESHDNELHVLVTGSLHLVGGILGLIDPGLESFKST